MQRRLSSVASVRKPINEAHAGTQILSVVCVLRERPGFDVSELMELDSELEALRTPTELVVVANGTSTEFVDSLRALVTHNGRLQVYVTRRRVDYATALIVGLENAIGDWVATIDVEADEPSIIRRLFDAAVEQRVEVALSSSPATRRGPVDAALSAIYHRVFRAMHGFTLTQEAPTARLFSRSVVNALLNHDSPLIAVETLGATGGYRRCSVNGTRRSISRRGLWERISERWRTLIGINAVPLRLANLMCGISAASAVAYSVYVVGVFLMKDDVMPGWTTISLMLSCTFFMLSVVLWLLSEYMLMLMDAGARRPRYEIAEEFGGKVHPSSGRLNVESEL